MGCPPFVEMATALKVFFSPEGSGMCTHQMATQIGEALCDGNGTLVKVYPVFSNTTPNRLEDRNMDSSKFEHHNITLHHESSGLLQFYDFFNFVKKFIAFVANDLPFWENGSVDRSTSQTPASRIPPLIHNTGLIGASSVPRLFVSCFCRNLENKSKSLVAT